MNTEIPGYKEVTIEQAADMIGYFTQKMESQGFPWVIYKPTDGFVKKMKPIGEFEALQRLKKSDDLRKSLNEKLSKKEITQEEYDKTFAQKAEPVIFEPRRVIGIGFNPKLQGKSSGGSTSSTSTTDDEGSMEVNSGGVEINFGEAMSISDFGELKFMYELYNPDVKVNPAGDDKLKIAAQKLAFFTKGTMAGDYPWKMYKPQDKLHKVYDMAKNALKSGGVGGAIGAATASLFSIPAIALGSLVLGPVGIVTGFAAGALAGGYIGAKKPQNGKEINVFETLKRLGDNQPVYFQEKKKREIGLSISFPVGVELGNLSFYSDHGKGSTISSLEELDLFHKIQNQVPEKDPKDPKNPKDDKDSKKTK